MVPRVYRSHALSIVKYIVAEAAILIEYMSSGDMVTGIQSYKVK